MVQCLIFPRKKINFELQKVHKSTFFSVSITTEGGHTENSRERIEYHITTPLGLKYAVGSEKQFMTDNGSRCSINGQTHLTTVNAFTKHSVEPMSTSRQSIKPLCM